MQTYPSISHAPVTWWVRCHHHVISVFQRLLKVKRAEDLLVSFDRACVQRPSKHKQNQELWLHMDQGYKRSFKDRGFQCVQGLLTLETMDNDDGTLVVMRGSHKLHEDFFKAFPARQTKTDDWVKFNAEELKWWATQGCTPERISAPAGSLVLWDSRTVHCGSYPLPNRKNPDRWRYVFYVSMASRNHVQSPETKKKLSNVLKRKRAAFENSRSTCHWPLKSKLFPKKPRWSHDQRPEDPNTLKVHTVQDLRNISPLAPCLAGFDA